MRIKVHVELDSDFNDLSGDENLIEFFVNDFPARPNVGDHFDVRRFMENKNLLTDQQDEALNSAFEIEEIEWFKDENGIYLEISLFTC